MPGYFSYRGTTGSSNWAFPIFFPTSFTSSPLPIQYTWEEFQQECEQTDHIWELKMLDAQEAEEQRYQEMKRKAELREDRKKYPLFFWRETCRKDSDQRETCKQKEKK